VISADPAFTKFQHEKSPEGWSIGVME
jgi:hypothetical protein